MALELNRSLLPPGYVAEARVKLGGQVEIDVGTFEENGPPSPAGGGIAVWAPPRPHVSLPRDWQRLESFEVLVIHEEEGPRVVAAIELISPANKDRPAHRQQFAVKCASYLYAGASVVMVDVVIRRTGNLHQELLALLDAPAETPGQGAKDLYAAAYRLRPEKDQSRLEIWAESLTLGGTLPTLPLWLDASICLPLEMEETYQAACAARRIG